MTARLMNVKIPAGVLAAIAAHIRASKTEVVIALLNEGLPAPAIRSRWDTSVPS